MQFQWSGTIAGMRNRRHTRFFAGFALTVMVCSQPSTPPKIEPTLLIEDFRIARAALEEGHSGIYRYTPKPVLDRAFDDAAKLLDHSMTAFEFYRVLAPAVTNIKCGHTSVVPPQDIQQAMNSTIPLFPFEVEVLDGKVYVYREYEPGDPRFAGLEIRRINGAPIDSILRTIIAATPGDGDSRTVRPWRIGHGREFPRQLYALLGIESPFDIEFRDPTNGKTTNVKLAGVTTPDRRAMADSRYPQDKRPDSTGDVKFLEDGKLAVLTIRSFGGGPAGPDKKPLGQYLDDAFREIHSRGSQALIIDVRDNGGGADELGKKVLSFLLDKPFQYYDDLVINKREFDFFRYAANARPIPAESVEKRADGKYHNITHPNSGVQPPVQPHFAGRVVAIMNGGSFSTTCEFLSNLHYRKRATFVGEEAAGGYYGNTSGRGALVTLPNTKVRVSIPLQTYYLAVKDAPRPNGSIPPDIEVKPTIRDLLSGNDTAMAKAIAELRKE
jgi:C-terminal processing protease CtpA/Prc